MVALTKDDYEDEDDNINNNDNDDDEDDDDDDDDYGGASRQIRCMNFNFHSLLFRPLQSTKLTARLLRLRIDYNNMDTHTRVGQLQKVPKSKSPLPLSVWMCPTSTTTRVNNLRSM